MSKFLTTLDKLSTADEAINAAGLNWNVTTEPVIASTGKKPKDRNLTIRQDTGDPLGVVSDRYHVLQNREAFAFMDELTRDPRGPKYVSAGSLWSGRKICLVADLGGMEVVKGDELRKHLVLAHAHDASMSVVTMLLPFRMFCFNQLNMAIKDAKQAGTIFKVRHTGDVKLKMDDIRETLGFINHQFDETLQLYKNLAAIQPTKEQTEEVLKRLLPDTKREGRAKAQRDRVLALADCDQGNAHPGVHGTAWALYNGITELVDHHNGSTSKREDKEDYQFDSKTFGLGAKFKAEALQVVVDTFLNN